MPLQIKNNTLLKVMHTKFTGRYALLHTICIGVRTLSTMQKLYGMVSQMMLLYNALITRYCYCAILLYIPVAKILMGLT